MKAAGERQSRLEASSNPFLLLPGYWSPAKADATREQLRRLMLQCNTTGEGQDARTMGAGRIARRHPDKYHLLVEFEEDSRLRAWAASHLERNSVTTSLLLGHVHAGQASGGGWHKDALKRGFKSMMYLEDVDERNGPFSMLLDYNESRLQPQHRLDGRQTRFNDSTIAREVALGARVHELYAPRGSVVVFETSSVHRGQPCKSGTRSSLTTYYQNTLRACGEPKRKPKPQTKSRTTH